MTDQSKIVDKGNQYFIPITAQNPVVMSHGKGCYLYDMDGKEYLDFAAAIAVASLGHADPEYVKIGSEQLGKVIALATEFTTIPKASAAEFIVETSCFDQVYFGNSGAEAAEMAIKIVRKWAHENKGPDKKEMIVFHGSFHGRTMGAFSLTSKRHSQPWFEPYLSGVHFAEFNNLDSVKALITDKTAAIALEPLQGEGGIVPADPDFIKGLRDLCDQHDLALLFDEVQTGFGRLGHLYAYQHYGVEPDIAMWAKGMGGGIPVSAVAGKKRFTQVMGAGTHGTTYGGNPLATGLADYVMRRIAKPEFLAHVNDMSVYLRQNLEDLASRSPLLEDVRGLGLLMGVDTVCDTAELRTALLKNGMVTTRAGTRTLRFAPPLIVQKAEIDKALKILEHTLKEFE